MTNSDVVAAGQMETSGTESHSRHITDEFGSSGQIDSDGLQHDGNLAAFKKEKKEKKNEIAVVCKASSINLKL